MSRLKEKALITLAHKGEESQPPRLAAAVYPQFVIVVTFSCLGNDPAVSPGSFYAPSSLGCSGGSRRKVGGGTVAAPSIASLFV